MGGRFNPRKQLVGKVPTDETPYEYRTSTEHWMLFPKAGIISVHGLQPSEDGTKLEMGRRKWKLERNFLKKRDDIFQTLLRTLISWRGWTGEEWK